MTFAEKLKKARMEKGMSQVELAEATGISPRALGGYEQGVRFPRSQETISNLASVLQVDLNYLLSDADAFVVDASAQYGARGARQASQLIQEVSGLFAGGEMAEEDMDEMMKALQDAYWKAKAMNKEKFTPKKYRTE